MSKNKKRIKIWKLELEGTITQFVISAIVIILLILYFLSPNIYLVTTAKYGKGSEIDNNNVKIALGETDTEERFLLYFQWYNVIHELGHGILRYNSSIKISRAEEEQLVNDFAVAYWLHYGEEEKINKLTEIVEYAVNHIKSDAEEGTNYMEFAKKNWNKPNFNTFNNYGWFQFSSVKEALNRRKSLEDVIREMGIENDIIIDNQKLIYSKINEQTSTQIINDAVKNFHNWQIKFPKAYQSFNNSPNANYSRNGKNFLGIYNIINKLSK